MDWTRSIDAYCERLGPGLLAEPLNAATNAAFLLAAALAFAEWRRNPEDRPALALIAMIAVIGVGSGLFHTFANAWSNLADVVPIAIFVHGYLFLALRRLLGLPWPTSLFSLAAFVAAEAVAVPALGSVLGGSAGYAPPATAIFIVAAILARRGHPTAGRIAAAGLVFAVSLTLRTADGPLCTTFPSGTHFLWHLLNALTLWLLTTAAMRHRRTT